MATAYLHVNGTDYELERTWESEDDESWQSFSQGAQAFALGGGAPARTFDVKVHGQSRELVVRLGGMVTFFVWLEKPPTRYAPKRIR